MRLLIVVILVMMTVEARAQEQPILDSEWNDDVRLWTARSVLGEVGWDRPGEWGAVAWVYATRARLSKQYTFIQMVKRYSAAIKGGNRHRNPWIFQLMLDKTRPSNWPQGPHWQGIHDNAWLRVIEFVDSWKAGNVENPCPGANHFGGDIDRHRAENNRWYRVKCNEGNKRFRNYFYDSTRRAVKIPFKRPRGF